MIARGHVLDSRHAELVQRTQMALIYGQSGSYPDLKAQFGLEARDAAAQDVARAATITLR